MIDIKRCKCEYCRGKRFKLNLGPKEFHMSVKEVKYLLNKIKRFKEFK